MEKSIGLIIAAFMVTFVFGSLLFMYFGGRRRLNEEVGEIPLFTEQIAGRFNDFYLSYFLVRHTYYNDFIVISYGNTRYVLKYSDIREVLLEKHIISKGVTYKHNIKSIPMFCSVFSFSYKRSEKHLLDKGVEIKRVNIKGMLFGKF